MVVAVALARWCSGEGWAALVPQWATMRDGLLLDLSARKKGVQVRPAMMRRSGKIQLVGSAA
jgi:hypothetical protein